jgi:hypothetical protein
MKKLLLVVLAVGVLLAPVVMAQSSDSKRVSIAAQWTGGVVLTLDKSALTYPLQNLPHNGVASNPIEGMITAHMVMSILPTHHIRFAMTSEAWVPAMSFGPEATLHLLGSGEGMETVSIPAPVIGAEATIFTTGIVLPAACDRSFYIQLRNVSAVPGIYTTGLTFILYDVL